MAGAEPELSRIVTRGEIARGEAIRDIAADERERAALARRFGLAALERLEARLRLRPEGPQGRPEGRPGLVTLEGRFSADVVQLCVVTLEGLPVTVEEEISLLFSLARPGEPKGPAALEVEIDAEAEDPPEPIGPHGLDLGEVVAEQLALALDPYPRAPDADLAALSGDVGAGDLAEEPDEPAGPFAALAALKPRD